MYKKQLLTLIIIFIISFSVFTLLVPTANAALMDNLEACKTNGNCTLDDFLRLAVNVSKIILGIVGSLTLLFFVYGGVIFLTSSGNKEMVTKGKNIIVGAVIGLLIVFASYTIIGFVMEKFVPDAKNKAWSTDTGYYQTAHPN